MNKLLFFLLISAAWLDGNAQQSRPDSIVQLSLEAYNSHDLEAFMSYFSKDIEMYNLGDCEPSASGIVAVRERYKDYFDASPDLHSEIKNRIVFDNKVIDYEYITGARGSKEPYELIFMYEVVDDKIVRTTAIRK